MLTIILAIAVLGTAAFFVIKGSASEKDQTKEPSIDEVVESSVKSPKSRQLEIGQCGPFVNQA